MSRFIKTSSGYLNQDHILLIRFGVAKEEEGHDLIQMSDGRIVQTQIQDFAWLAPEVRLEAEALHRPEEAADKPKPVSGWAQGGFGEPRPQGTASLRQDPKPKYDEEEAKPA